MTDWKGTYNPAGEAAFAEMLMDPNNPLRRVRDVLLAQAKQMIQDGRLKIVDGRPVFSPEVEQQVAEREARRHRYCTESDPCGGVPRPLKAPPRRSQGPSRRSQRGLWKPQERQGVTMPRLDRPITITAETIDLENPEGLDNALRILAHLAIKKYLQEHQIPVPGAQVGGAAPASGSLKAMPADELEGRRLLDIDGLSKYLSMPKPTIYSWVSMRKIPPQAVIRLGRALRFDRAEIDRWLDARRAAR